MGVSERVKYETIRFRISAGRSKKRKGGGGVEPLWILAGQCSGNILVEGAAAVEVVLYWIRPLWSMTTGAKAYRDEKVWTRGFELIFLMATTRAMPVEHVT